MARRRRQNAGLRTLDQMDVTPLVDLTFILLIVFMLTAPALEYSIDVDLPEKNAGEIDKSKENKIISLSKDGVIYFEDRQLRLEELQSHLKSINRPNYTFLIRGDQDISYGKVISLLAALNNAGIENVELITSAED